MKKEFMICFVSNIMGASIISPIKDKKFSTIEEAENAVQHLITGQPAMMFTVLPVYTKS